MAHSGQHPRWSIPLATVMIVAATLVARAPSLFTDPRFWAEEAGYFYGRFLNESALSALAYIHVGSYQLLANLMVLAAAHVPMWAAPAVTTYAALGILLVVSYQVGIFLREYAIGWLAGFMLIIAFTLQWGMYEVALSATNVQWIVGISCLILLALPCAWLDRNLLPAGAWLLICGLSGIPAAVCAPAFAVKAAVFRSRSTAIAAALLFACVAVQAACVLIAGTPGRDLHKSLPILIMPTLLQTGIELFTGPEPIFLIGTYINGALPNVRMLMLATGALGAGLIATGAVLARDAVKDRIVWILLFAWAYVSFVQTFGAFHPQQLLSASGARYYVFGVTAFLLLLALATKNASTAPRAIAFGALALACAAGIGQRFLGDWTPAMTTGPSWKQQVRSCKPDERCVVRAWPNDGTVYLLLEDGKVRSSYYPERLPDLPALR